MSVKSNPGTGSQAEESKISEITMSQDTGQTPPVIEWLRRADPARDFLRAPDRVWSYREAVAEVEARLAVERPRHVDPDPTPQSIFDIIAGVSGGGLIVGGDGRSAGDIGEDTALVVFTSGSTGEPKGVRLTRENIEAAARSSVEHLGHGEDDVWLLGMSLRHVAGLSILMRQAFTGGTVRLLSGFDAFSFADAMRADVTMVSVVPTMLTDLVSLGPFDGLRAVLVGGGPIPDGLLESAAAAGLPVLPTYGMTETFGQVATLRPGARLGRRAHPLPGIDLRITDDGRIAIRGDQVFPGYVGLPDRDYEWFVTNDLGVIDDDGALIVLGRADDMIVTGGENVAARLVEEAISEHPGVVECIVVGVPDERWGQRVRCVYTGEVSPLELKEFLRDRLEPFQIPKEWVVTKELPRTDLGKPDRAAASGSDFGG